MKKKRNKELNVEGTSGNESNGEEENLVRNLKRGIKNTKVSYPINESKNTKVCYPLIEL